jgi:hypothetical protein
MFSIDVLNWAQTVRGFLPQIMFWLEVLAADVSQRPFGWRAGCIGGIVVGGLVGGRVIGLVIGLYVGRLSRLRSGRLIGINCLWR